MLPLFHQVRVTLALLLDDEELALVLELLLLLLLHAAIASAAATATATMAGFLEPRMRSRGAPGRGLEDRRNNDAGSGWLAVGLPGALSYPGLPTLPGWRAAVVTIVAVA